MRHEDLLSSKEFEIAEATIATNLLGPIRLNSALLPHLLQQPTASIMVVSSALAFLPWAMTPTYCATKSAIHSWSQLLRYQLRKTNVEVLELIPPYTQTELLGAYQATDPRAVPLQKFVDEVMDILKTQPTPAEIVVQSVLPLRNAEQSGQEKYDAVFKQFNDYFNDGTLGPHY